MSEYPTYLSLKKQRFKYKEYNSKFCAETQFVKNTAVYLKTLYFTL